MQNKKRIVRIKSSNGKSFDTYENVSVSLVRDIQLLYVGFGMTKIYAWDFYHNTSKDNDFYRVVMLNGEEIRINKKSLNMYTTKSLYKVEFDGETEWFIIDKNMGYTFIEGEQTLEKFQFSMKWDEINKCSL